MTMRLLTEQPALIIKLLAFTLGVRSAATLATILTLIDLERAAIAINLRTSNSLQLDSAADGAYQTNETDSSGHGQYLL
jgi:hypothetical protein